MAKRPAQTLECTLDCRLRQHADFVLSCVALKNLRLIQHCSSVCANYLKIADGQGRTPLLVAASLGHQLTVEWLVEKKAVSVDVQDLESGWTPLHRSIFFGHLGTAVYLVKNRANMKQSDYDGMEPLSLLSDGLVNLRKSSAVGSVNLYTWGTNINATLGHDHTRKHPQKLDVAAEVISQVVLCKFHSVYLSKTGCVLTSGHGQGGRLGHGNEQSVMAPRVVEAVVSQHCIQVAAARDHTVMLTKSGVMYSCGLNDAHQLGHGSNPTNCPANFLQPKPIKTLKNIIAVGVGRYHTAACTSSELYTFGKNLGQLGYEKTYDTQIAPRSVPGVSVDNGDSIHHLSVSDAGTACLTRKHRIFICTEFAVKTVKWGFFDRMECLQFALRASLTDLETKRDREIYPASVVMLDSEHKLWYWNPSKKGNPPAIVPGLAKLNATSFSLGKSLTVVTEQGEAFTGPLRPDGALLSKMSHVQNATAVFTDFKGNNFAYLQSVYRPPTLPEVSASTLAVDLCSLLDDGHLSDLTVSMMNQHGCMSIAAHKAVLASCSPVLRGLLEGQYSSLTLPPGVKSFTDAELILDTSCLQAMQALLYWMYGSQVTITCNKDPSAPQVHVVSQAVPVTKATVKDEDDLTDLYDKYINTASSWDTGDHPKVMVLPNRISEEASGHSVPNHTSGNTYDKVICCESSHTVLHELQSFATYFKVDGLKKRIAAALESKKSRLMSITIPAYLPAVCKGCAFSDLVLVSSEGEHLSCHRCVLVARSEYFHSMLLMGWRESSNTVSTLNLQISHHVLQAVVDYIYNDTISDAYSQSIESVSAVLVVADQLLMTRLKETCELALANTITLKNVTDIAQFAVTYGADQLKIACLQFICINAVCLLEERYLDSLDSALYDELSTTYLQMVDSNVRKRQIKFAQPDQSMLPLTYFMDDKENVSEMAEIDVEPDVVDKTIGSPGEGFTSPLEIPRAVSGKKKRRRKSSAGDQQASSPVGVAIPLVIEGTPSPPTSPVGKAGGRNIESPDVSTQKFEFKGHSDETDVKRKSTSVKAWKATSPLPINRTSNLKDIMAHEEMLQTPGVKVPSVSMKSPSGKLIPSYKSNIGVSTPSCGLPSPPSKSSPWCSKSVAKAPPVSLKELMAIEEKKSSGIVVEPLATPSKERSVGRRQPPTIVQPRVSFASIIEAQEKAEVKHRKSSIKALHLIQIEEQAILQMETLYCARSNADEWITVQRCAPSGV